MQASWDELLLQLLLQLYTITYLYENGTTAHTSGTNTRAHTHTLTNILNITRACTGRMSNWDGRWGGRMGEDAILVPFRSLSAKYAPHIFIDET